MSRTPRTRATHTISRVSAHVTVAHHSPTSHRWLDESSIRVCVFSRVILSKNMFHRNLLGVPDLPHLLSYCAANGSRHKCADPRSDSWFGRVAEQSAITQALQNSAYKVRLNQDARRPGFFIFNNRKGDGGTRSARSQRQGLESRSSRNQSVQLCKTVFSREVTTLRTNSSSRPRESEGGKTKDES